MNEIIVGILFGSVLLLVYVFAATWRDTKEEFRTWLNFTIALEKRQRGRR